MDNMAFARLIEKKGKHLCWVFGDRVMRTRMYKSFAEIWAGFGKNMSDIIAHQSAITAMLAALRSLLIAWVPPIILAIAAWQFAHTGAVIDRVSLVLASVAFAGLYFFFIMMLHALRVPLHYVACTPLGFSLHALLVFVSLGKKHNKTRQWKGRTLPWS